MLSIPFLINLSTGICRKQSNFTQMNQSKKEKEIGQVLAEEGGAQANHAQTLVGRCRVKLL
jgi:hypothetical protein